MLASLFLLTALCIVASGVAQETQTDSNHIQVTPGDQPAAEIGAAKKADVLLVKAKQAYNDEDYKLAIELLKEVRELQPDNFEAQLLLVMMSSCSGATPEQKAGVNKHYRLVPTWRIDKILEAFACGGYAIKHVRNDTMLMEKVTVRPDTYRYWPRAGSSERIPFEKRFFEMAFETALNKLGARGFRSVPGLAKWMEKAPGAETRYEYRVLFDENIPNLQMQAARAVEQGFELVDIWVTPECRFLVSHTMESPTIILERTIETTAADVMPSDNQATSRGSLPYLVLRTKRGSKMEKTLNQAAATGYRLVAAAQSCFHFSALAKTYESAATYEYLMRETMRTSTLQKELNEAAGHGFRVHPRALYRHDMNFSVIMEKTANSPKGFEYLVLETSRRSTLEKEINQASQQGYQVVGLIGDSVALLEKPIESTTE
jgi:hypothetical protein